MSRLYRVYTKAGADVTKGRWAVKIRGDEKTHQREGGILMKTVTFDDNELQRLRMIVIDQDKGEALDFLVAIWERIKDKESTACGPKVV